jgi:hypothetical protein
MSIRKLPDGRYEWRHRIGGKHLKRTFDRKRDAVAYDARVRGRVVDRAAAWEGVRREVADNVARWGPPTEGELGPLAAALLAGHLAVPPASEQQQRGDLAFLTHPELREYVDALVASWPAPVPGEVDAVAVILRPGERSTA